MEEIESRVLNVIDEQRAVQFTGKVNILASFNRQFLGHILFKDGEMIQVTFNGLKGLKAFYNLMIQEYSLQSFDLVVEPELVDDKERQIHYPFAVIRNKLTDVIRSHKEALKLRPPENIKIIVDAEFVDDSLPVSSQEYEVLSTLTEWNTPADLYQHCPLLDHEITLSLVSLRKKGALKILAPRH